MSAASVALGEPSQQATVQELASAAAATAGLSVAAMDAHIFEAALKRRMRAAGSADAAAYLVLHRENAAEREAYLEEVLIGETSFFRDAAVFAEMTRWAMAWLSSHARPMRILSAPCSTGEEPYSIAAALLEAGVAPGDFAIDAVDISALAIEHARAGVYHGFALRNVVEPGQATFLEASGSGWKVSEGVRQCVRFWKANLLDADTLAGHKYDLIFVRNLMIYQTPQARARMALTLAAALAESGRLVVGSADWGADLGEHFALEQPVQSFALRHKGLPTLRPVGTQVREAGPVRLRSGQAGAPVLCERESESGEPVAVRRYAKLALSDQVKEAAELARVALAAEARGESGTAEWICRQALYLDGTNLDALELLGRLERPRASRRMHLALHARLHRLRSATAEAKTP